MSDISIGIVVGTYGDPEWEVSGHRLSCMDYGAPIIHHHGENIAAARNGGATMIGTEYIIFLDADDDLDDGYVKAMAVAAEKYPEASIFQPSTLGIYADGSTDEFAMVIPERNIFVSNNLVIGSMVRAKEFFQVGGFKDIDALEDWELFLNMICNAKSKVAVVPDAVYCVGVSDSGRNSSTGAHHVVYNKIRQDYSGYQTPGFSYRLNDV